MRTGAGEAGRLGVGGGREGGVVLNVRGEPGVSNALRGVRGGVRGVSGVGEVSSGCRVICEVSVGGVS